VVTCIRAFREALISPTICKNIVRSTTGKKANELETQKNVKNIFMHAKSLMACVIKMSTGY